MRWLLVALAALLAWLLLSDDSSGADIAPGDYNEGFGAPVQNLGGFGTRKPSAGDLAAALVPTEGQPGDLNYRNNNPGNLRVPGDLGTDASGFGIFSSWEKGFAALEDDINAKLRKYPHANLQQLMARYLGQGGDPATIVPQKTTQGDPVAKANAIAKALGVSSTDPVGSVFGG
jgi:hypothetical protein